MKFRKFMLMGAFGIALTASFAFKNANQFFVHASYHPTVFPLQCNSANPTDDDCDRFNQGSICTTYDSYDHVYVQAYEDGGIGNRCIHPLYHQF